LVELGGSIFELIWLFFSVGRGSVGGGVLGKSGGAGVWNSSSVSGISSSCSASLSSWAELSSSSETCFSFCSFCSCFCVRYSSNLLVASFSPILTSLYCLLIYFSELLFAWSVVCSCSIYFLIKIFSSSQFVIVLPTL
jgi:hypothetical protein